MSSSLAVQSATPSVATSSESFFFGRTLCTIHAENVFLSPGGISLGWGDKFKNKFFSQTFLLLPYHLELSVLAMGSPILFYLNVIKSVVIKLICK